MNYYQLREKELLFSFTKNSNPFVFYSLFLLFQVERP